MNNMEYTLDNSLKSIYGNINKNTNYLINNYFTLENKTNCLLYFDEDTFNTMIKKGKHNISVEVVADIIGVTKQSVYHTLNGQCKPTFDKIFSFSKFFNVPLNDFIFEDMQTLETNVCKSKMVLNDAAVDIREAINRLLDELPNSELEKVFEFAIELNSKIDKDIMYYK